MKNINKKEEIIESLMIEGMDVGEIGENIGVGSHSICFDITLHNKKSGVLLFDRFKNKGINGLMERESMSFIHRELRKMEINTPKTIIQPFITEIGSGIVCQKMPGKEIGEEIDKISATTLAQNVCDWVMRSGNMDINTSLKNNGIGFHLYKDVGRGGDNIEFFDHLLGFFRGVDDKVNKTINELMSKGFKILNEKNNKTMIWDVGSRNVMIENNTPTALIDCTKLYTGDEMFAPGFSSASLKMEYPRWKGNNTYLKEWMNKMNADDEQYEKARLFEVGAWAMLLGLKLHRCKNVDEKEVDRWMGECEKILTNNKNINKVKMKIK